MTNDSRYSISKTKSDDLISIGRVRQELWPSLRINTEDASYYVVNVSDIGRLDNISHAVYGRSDLWWAIALVNKVKNTFSDLTVGQTLLIPTISAVIEAMERARMLLPTSGSNT